MGLFSGNREENNTPRNPDMVFGFRALAAGYILYMVYQTVKMYFTEPGHDLKLMIVTVAILTPGALFVLISGYLSWRKEKKALEEAQKQQQEEQEESESGDTEE